MNRFAQIIPGRKKMRSGKNMAKKGSVAEKGRAGWGPTSCISRQPIWRKGGKGEQGGESGDLPKGARWKGVTRSGVRRSDWQPSQPNKEGEEAGAGKGGSLLSRPNRLHEKRKWRNMGRGVVLGWIDLGIVSREREEKCGLYDFFSPRQKMCN